MTQDGPTLQHPLAVPHNRLTCGALEVAAVTEVVSSGRWAMGRKVAELEAALAWEAGVSHAICVGSGVGALRLALLALGVRPGDKVLVPAYSCVALANATLACGAEAVPVDVELDRWNPTPEGIVRAAAQTAPRAIIAVNTFGLPARIEAMRAQVAAPILEDCAHAFGLPAGSRRLGGRGHVGILSFHATKLVGAGEGGAILTDSDRVAAFARQWRDYGDQPADGTRLNDKMTDLEAALALCQLQRLPASIAARRRLADRYDECLRPASGAEGAFELPIRAESRVWYRYAVRLRQATARDAIAHLRTCGIQAAEPIEPWDAGRLLHHPNAALATERVLSLPLYPTLTDEDQDRVIQSFLDFCRRPTRG